MPTRTHPRDPADFVPLTPVTFEILLSLAGGERHGYAIMLDIERRTEGRISLHPGTLYRAIARLTEGDLLDEIESEPGPEDDERRRYYGLSELGRAVAEAEARRLESQVGAARAANLLGRPSVI